MKTKTIHLHHYGHPRAWFDTRHCREAFRADRRAGLVYGPYFLRDQNRFARDAEEASALAHFCPYCGTPGTPVERRVQTPASAPAEDPKAILGLTCL